MGILTKSRLTTITGASIGVRAFSDVLNEAKLESKVLASTSIFLSHCHDDREEVKKVVVFLRKRGVRVYVDWLDSSLPPITSGETAAKIKQQIQSNKKFVFLATNNAIASKWCNWELGFGDAYKYINNIALFPLADNSSSWNGNEYLKIYPRIEESNVISDYYKVIFPNGKDIEIADWLKQ